MTNHDTLSMRGSRRQSSALALLGTTALSWLSIALLALHVEAHGGHDHETDAAVAAAALHGHHHETGTPDHEHRFTLAPVAPLPTKLVLQPLAVGLVGMSFESPALRVGLAPRADGLGHDPPHRPPSSVSILRV